MEKTNKVYGLLLDPRAIDLRTNYGKLEIRIVDITDGKVRNPDSDSPYRDLTFRVQWDKDNQDRTYGWEVRYRDAFIIGLREAERMVKMLRKIESIEQKLPVRPQTFGQYVGLIAAGLKLDSAKKVAKGETSSYYPEMSFQDWKLSEAGWLIDSMIEEARKPQEVEAARS